MSAPTTHAVGGGSIRRRLVLSLGGALAVASLLVGAATYRDVHHEIDELLDDHLAQSASLLAAQAADDLDELRPGGEGAGARRVAFQVWRGGALLGRSPNAPVERLAAATGWSDAVHDGSRWRVYVRALDDEVEVQVAELHAVREQLARRAALRATAPFAASVPMIALLAWLLVRRGFRPLERLGQEVSRRGADDLSPVPSTHVPREAAPLVRALDGLLLRVADALESERRLTADAAHELRTPLAAIRAQAQVALREPDAAAQRRALESVIAGCDRASRLADQLLALARADAAGAADRTDVDLRALTCEVLAETAPDAIARGLEPELADGLPVPASADAALWRVLVRNLVDNASRYAQAGGRVQVTVRREGTRAVLEVADAGPGLAPELRGRVGQRFVRGSGTGAPGSGLGLSIVARIAALHGGRVEFLPGIDGAGLCVRVTIDA
jgi:two-component system sensor histidine kinase QseC